MDITWRLWSDEIMPGTLTESDLDAASGKEKAARKDFEAKIPLSCFVRTVRRLRRRRWTVAPNYALLRRDSSDRACRHSVPARSLAFSADGAWLAAGCDDGTVIAWETQTGGIKLYFKASDHQISALTIADSGNGLFVGDVVGGVSKWSTTKGHPPQHFSGQARTITDLAVDSQERHLFTSYDDGTIRIWNPQTGTMSKVLVGHRSAVRQISFSPRDQRLYSVDMDGMLRAWRLDVDTSNEQSVPGDVIALTSSERSSLYAIAYSSGENLSDRSYYVQIFGAANGETTLLNLPDHLKDIAISPMVSNWPP